jgi:hypothetical protein
VSRQNESKSSQCQRRVAATVYRLLLIAMLGCSCEQAFAGGGPLGIDHEWNYDDHGIWNRNVQYAVFYSVIGGQVALALWEGGDTRLGHTMWQSIDSSVASALTIGVLKYSFSRVRPVDGHDPDLWFKGNGNVSFPSGEVGTITAVVTPIVLEYGKDHPGVYALELLPLYDAIARMKVQGHWQTDVIAGFLIGTAWGFAAHNRESPFILNILPGGFSVGIKKRF